MWSRWWLWHSESIRGQNRQVGVKISYILPAVEKLSSPPLLHFSGDHPSTFLLNLNIRLTNTQQGNPRGIKESEARLGLRHAGWIGETWALSLSFWGCLCDGHWMSHSKQLSLVTSVSDRGWNLCGWIGWMQWFSVLQVCFLPEGFGMCLGSDYLLWKFWTALG